MPEFQQRITTFSPDERATETPPPAADRHDLTCNDLNNSNPTTTGNTQTYPSEAEADQDGVFWE